MFDSFRGPLPIFLLDPATNRVVRGIPAGDFNGRPYIAFPGGGGVAGVFAGAIGSPSGDPESAWLCPNPAYNKMRRTTPIKLFAQEKIGRASCRERDE